MKDNTKNTVIKLKIARGMLDYLKPIYSLNETNSNLFDKKTIKKQHRRNIYLSKR